MRKNIKNQNRPFILIATLLFTFMTIMIVWGFASYALQEQRGEALKIEKDNWKEGERNRILLEKEGRQEKNLQKIEKDEQKDYLAEKEIDERLMKDREALKGWAVENEETFYNVLYIYDGDTIAIDMNGVFEKVRFIGIDTPETGEKYRGKECYGKEATEKTEELLFEKKVSLKSDETQDNEDKYGRLLRYVFLEDGTMLNKKLIEDGFAKEYTYKGSAYKYQKEFRAAEKKAKREEVGLWAECVR